MKKILVLIFTILNVIVFSQNKIILDITVLNEYSGESISFANVKLVNLSTNQILRKKTNFNGNIKLDLSPDQKYVLFASAESDSSIVIFNEKKKEFSTNGIQNTLITTSMKIRPIFQKDGLKFIGNVNFSIFTYDLDKLAKAKLNNVIDLMQKYPEINIEVSGYAACNLSEEDANQVAVARATNVFTYLTNSGIDYTRIKAAAWGKEKSITKCKCIPETRKDKPCTKKHHIINSRVGLIYSNL